MIKWKVDAEKLTDQAFNRLLITSLFWIFLAVVCLCSVTWAWFGTSISSPPITLEAGTYNAEMTVYATSQAAGADGTVTETLTELAPYEIDGTIQRYAFDKDVLYRVRVDLSDSTSNGYCKIYVDGLQTVYANLVTEDGVFEFAVRISANTTVSIETRWGIYSGESAFEDGDTIELTVPSVIGGSTDETDTAPTEEATSSEEAVTEESSAETSLEEVGAE